MNKRMQNVVDVRNVERSNNSKLASVKRKLERESGMHRPRLHKTISIKVEIQEFEDLDQIRMERDKLRRSSYMEKEVLAVYRNGEFVRVIDPEVKGLYKIEDYEVRTVTNKQISSEKNAKISYIKRCELLARKKELDYDEVNILQDMLMHIEMYERSERMMKLRRDIEKSLDKFFI
jgi:hypothetical protein